ncbi:MAG: 5-(carboxyamino)imidazole ribonucleotide synthase, partial [Verrucomicrobia bacterium]|nr:5-(carboxyamino)imidazole ribonucleotide synthase [Verrucomicrobiota bacterium]
MSPTSVILPGATIGILGSGQLGRMLAIAAKQMGYRVAIFSPEADSPAGDVADRDVVARYDDLDAVRAFAQSVDVVTFEFENVPSAATAAAAERAPVRPDGRVLHITQQRLREKGFLLERGFPVTPFRRVVALRDLEAALRDLGLPGVLKTASFGYDGKGQTMLRSARDVAPAFAGLKGAEGIYEAFVDFEKEISVVGARTFTGAFQAFPVFENTHAHHILDVTFAPAAISAAQTAEATRIAAGILEALEVVGLLTVEMFVARDGRILVNELAPRTHNSGHLTLDACPTSQFEQQLRAVCGLPLGDAALHKPAAMANLLGHLWEGGEPNWRAALEDPAVKLHLYGKAEARVGRKMGHLNALGGDAQEAVRRVL